MSCLYSSTQLTPGPEPVSNSEPRFDLKKKNNRTLGTMLNGTFFSNSFLRCFWKTLILKVVAVAYESFYSERFVRDNFGVLDRLWSLACRGWSHMEVSTVCELNVRDKPFLSPPSSRAMFSRLVLSRATTCLSTPNNAILCRQASAGFKLDYE